MSEPIWEPDLSAVGHTNVGRFLAAQQIDTFDELLARSIDDPAWFWGEAAEFLGIPFSTPYEQVLDTSDGIAWARWFTGGRTNLAAACVDRWATSTPDAEAVRWEGEDGEVRVLTYADLARHVDGLAALLRERGIGRGDSVGIFLPMLVETVVAALAVAKVGAIFLPVFSGYGADAIAVRLRGPPHAGVITAQDEKRASRRRHRLVMRDPPSGSWRTSKDQATAVPRSGNRASPGVPRRSPKAPCAPPPRNSPAARPGR